MSRRLLAALAFAALAFEAFPATALGPGFDPVAVRTTPIDAFRPGSGETRFGSLVFLGGIEIASSDRRFGGLSGLDILPDGKTIVAVADTGYWFTAELTGTDGEPLGLANAGIAPLLLDNGRPPISKIAGDAEGLRIIVRDGRPAALVSFEQVPAVRVYAGPDFASSVPRHDPLPDFVYGLPSNQGLESVAEAPADGPLAGSVLVVAERALDEAGNHRGFVLTGPRAGEFAIRRTDDFDITDAAFLPGGDLVILERKFSYAWGPATRLRRIASAEIARGATVDGAVLMEADGAYAIDNMEGLAVSSDSGRTLVTLISDNNTSFLQRTLLLRFALSAE